MAGTDAVAVEALTLGEALVDLVPRAADRWVFDARPGGAPANVAVGLARFGRSVGLIGKVGMDALGDHALQAIADAGVRTEFVQRDRDRPTPLTVVQPDSHDTERYVLYREGAADGALSATELPVDAIAAARVLHVGGLSLSADRSRAATLRAIAIARRHGGLVSADVNLRALAWPSVRDMVSATRGLLALVDVVKLTRHEAKLLLDGDERLPVQAGAIVLMTDGARTARLTRGALEIETDPPPVDVVDASGAGDAFMAGFLHRLLSGDPRPEALERIPADDLAEALTFACQAGAAAVRGVGAMEGALVELDRGESAR